MTYTKLTNGERYALEELFSGDNKIIIPDLQRDYCWSKQLITDFVNGLISNSADDDYPLGLIYGYGYPMGHIQLCDGQQRITTIFLLVGLLYRRTGYEYLRQILMSDFEMTDDYEPRLQYAIRESTLYFLSDLVHWFFIENRNLEIDDISRQMWYFHDYDLDPSIRNMIDALRIMDQILNSADKGNGITMLCEFIAHKISFLYYDLRSRRNGEETFVIINTTGEPLSVTENLKPVIINRMQVDRREEGSLRWEEMETWFWQHRMENDTADNGLLEFFRWQRLLTGQPDMSMKEIALDSLWSYFVVVRELFANPKIFQDRNLLAPQEKGNTQIDWFRILPVIEYAHSFGVKNERDILRVRNYFGHLAFIPNIGRDIQNLLPKAIDIVKNMARIGQKDIAAYIVSDETISSAFRSEEELFKFGLYLETDCRDAYEDRFWASEEHQIWQGEILPLLRWSMQDGKFSLQRFDRLNEIFNNLFSCEDLDLTRRALLTWGLDDYPRQFRGYTNYSFCQQPSDWKMLIMDNFEKFGSFVEFLSGAADMQTAQQEIIDAYAGHSEWADFIRVPEFLQYCEQKNVQKWWQSTVLIKHTRATTYVYAEVYKLYLRLSARGQKWQMPWGDTINKDGTPLEIRYDGQKQLFRLSTTDLETANKYALTKSDESEGFVSGWENDMGIEDMLIGN